MASVPIRVFPVALAGIADMKLAYEKSVVDTFFYLFMFVFTVIPLGMDYFYPNLVEGGVLSRFGCIMVVVSVLFASNIITYKRYETSFSDEISLIGISEETRDEVVMFFLDNYKDISAYGLDIDEDKLNEHEKKLYELSNLYLGMAESRLNAKHVITMELILAGYGSFLWGFGDLMIGWIVGCLFSTLMFFNSYHNFRYTRHLKPKRQNELTRKLLMRK